MNTYIIHAITVTNINLYKNTDSSKLIPDS